MDVRDFESPNRELKVRPNANINRGTFSNLLQREQKEFQEFPKYEPEVTDSAQNEVVDSTDEELVIPDSYATEYGGYVS